MRQQSDKSNYNNKRRVDKEAALNERFVAARKLYGVTQKEWAAKLTQAGGEKITLNTVAAIERYDVNPNYAVIRAWKKTTGQSYASILDGVHDKKEPI